MSDPVTPTDQTSPLDAGHTTSEYALTKVVVFLSGLVSVAGVVMTAVQAIAPIFAPTKYGPLVGVVLAVGGATVAAVKTWLYEVERTALKQSALPPSQS